LVKLTFLFDCPADLAVKSDPVVEDLGGSVHTDCTESTATDSYFSMIEKVVRDPKAPSSAPQIVLSES
jgi:hypothetical protein